jgi:transposase
MPGSAAKVVITERQQALLQEIVNGRTAPVRLVQRAQVVLQAFAGVDNADIAQQIGLGPDAVGLWRRRWAKVWPPLTVFECAENRADLRRAITAVLSDQPRSGNPGKFTPEQVTRLLALACEPPEPSGRPITHWTNAELADAARQQGIVPSSSAAQVGRYLREAGLQPHRSKYWLNTKEKDRAQFQAKVEEVCDCYRAAPRLYAEQNTHAACTDEMTGIQALERIAAALPMGRGQAECREFEYARHGTLTLIGNSHVVTGELLAPSLGPTRTEADFVRHVAQTVSTQPEASWVFVVDNLNIHASASLVQWVSQFCSAEQDLGGKRRSGSAEVASAAPRVSVPGAAGALRVLAQAHVVAQPNGDRVRCHHAQGNPPWHLHLDDGLARPVAAFHCVFQRGFRQALSLDLHRSPAANRRTEEDRQATPTVPTD